jgi:hypothetical protein
MTSKKQMGRPSEVGPYVALIKTTPKGETVTVGNLPTNEAYASHQAADYRRKTILAKFGKSAGKSTVTIVRADDAREVEYNGVEALVPGYFLVLAGRAKQA